VSILIFGMFRGDLLLLVQEFMNDLKPNQDPKEKPLRMSDLVVGVLDGIISRSQTATLDDARLDGLEPSGVMRTAGGIIVRGRNIVMLRIPRLVEVTQLLAKVKVVERLKASRGRMVLIAVVLPTPHRLLTFQPSLLLDWLECC